MFDNIMFDEEILFTYIGYAAGLATILTFAIQILRIVETKHVTNLSSYMYIIYSLGLVCWFAYGVYIDSYILLFSNLITFFCTFIILILIIYYDAEDKIERERRDDITTVYNRKYFEQAVPEKIAQALVAKQNFALVMLKVDNLAEFRQKYGDKTADKALKQVGGALEKDLRGTDMVARYDNEKFVIFLANSDEKGTKTVAGRLSENIKKLSVKINRKQNLDLTVSMGACSSKHAKALTAITNPIVNSYKRLLSGGPRSGATWAPVYITYGGSNRTQMIRIPGPGRIENRTVDGAANPYLTCAALLAAGLDGIEQQIDPGNRNDDNLYMLSVEELNRRKIDMLPRSLAQAIDYLEEDEVVKNALGTEYAAYYIQTKREEWRQYHSSVSQWEVDNYLGVY